MSDERGFTLVELLVAILMTSVVIFAASEVIISSLNVTNQVTGRENALEEGRTGMESLMQQLNSGCLSAGTSPVFAASSGISPSVVSNQNQLVFVSSVDGSSANPVPTEHVVQLNGNGALVDKAYTGTGSGPSTWSFSSTPSQVLTLAENVTAGKGPMFSYYAYSTSTNSLLNAPILSTPLTTTSAPTVAEVDIDFRVGPPGGTSNSTETTELTDSAVFNLTADGSASTNRPCE